MIGRPFELKNGFIFVLAEAAGGVYNSSQLKTICEVSEDDSAFLKITEDQRIGFIINPEHKTEIESKLARVGVLLKNYRGHSFVTPKACLGELCPKSKQDALGDAIDLSDKIGEKLNVQNESLSVGMNGCEIGCATSATDDVHIIGQTDGYKISIGGQSCDSPHIAQEVVTHVSKENLAPALEKIIQIFIENKNPEETLSNTVKRIGLDKFTEALSAFSQKPSDRATQQPARIRARACNPPEPAEHPTGARSGCGLRERP